MGKKLTDRELKELQARRDQARKQMSIDNQRLRVKDHEAPEARSLQLEHLRNMAKRHLEKADQLEKFYTEYAKNMEGAAKKMVTSKSLSKKSPDEANALHAGAERLRLKAGKAIDRIEQIKARQNRLAKKFQDKANEIEKSLKAK